MIELLLWCGAGAVGGLGLLSIDSLSLSLQSITLGCGDSRAGVGGWPATGSRVLRSSSLQALTFLLEGCGASRGVRVIVPQ